MTIASATRPALGAGADAPVPQASSAAARLLRPRRLRAPPSRRRKRRSQRPTEPFVIAANPLAAQAGLNVLKRGGSAVDAAVAVQAMLSLVEPQSSGVGGGAFMTYYDARTRQGHRL